MARLLLALVVLVLSTAAPAQDRDYAAGQIWEYRTAAGDEGSLIKIQQIETIEVEGGSAEVFHISMINLRGPGGNGLIREVQHLPVSRGTLDDSVTRLSTSTAAFPDYRGGLQQWREANGGVFTITLAEIGNVVRQSIARGEAR